MIKSHHNHWYRFIRNFNIWMVYAIFIVLVLTIPVFTIIINIFEGPGETMQHLYHTLLLDYIFNSVVLMLGVGSLALVLGISTAWFVSTCNFPGRSFFEWALILPLAVPTYIIAITYAGIFDYFGSVQAFFRNTLDSTFPTINIMSRWGVILVMAFVLYPYVYVVARASFSSQSRTILESSRILGAGAVRTFFKIALPVARPAVIGGLTLVLMEVLNDYGAVKYYGVSTFTTGIFRSWLSMGDFNAAIYLSAILMIFVLTLIFAERYQRGNARYDESASSTRPLRRYKLNTFQQAGCIFACLIPLCFGFLIPVSQLLTWSLRTAEKIINQEFYQLVINSFSVALTTSLVCIFVATLLLYSVKLNQYSLLKGLAKVATLGYSIPGAVIAVGIMIPLLFLDKGLINNLEQFTGNSYGLILSGTSFALIFAYMVRFLAVSYNPIESGFKKVCNNLDEASRSLGASPLKTLVKIDLPLIKGTILSGALLVFVDVMKELPITLILRPFNFNTLATKAFEYAGNEMIAESSSAALIIIATGIIPIILLSSLISRKERSGFTD